MKNVFFTIIAVVIFSAINLNCGCKPVTGSAQKYKARFEIAAICSNYTFSVIEGNIDTALVVANWTDSQTSKTYKNAFGIANPCTFPNTIKEGDTFYFVIDNNPPKSDCAVCMAYYPVPEKRLNIKVVK